MSRNYRVCLSIVRKELGLSSSARASRFIIDTARAMVVMTFGMKLTEMAELAELIELTDVFDSNDGVK